MGHLVNDVCRDNCPESTIALCPHGSVLLHDDLLLLIKNALNDTYLATVYTWFGTLAVFLPTANRHT